MSKIYAGIDPGMSGAVASILDDGTVLGCWDTPIVSGSGKNQYNIRDMVHILGGACPDGVILEQVGAMPGQGVTSMFRFGEGFGIWQGILGALDIPYALVRPQAWTKAMLAGEAKGDCRGLLAARRRWPEVSLARKKDNGRSDALWLAEYGRLYHWNHRAGPSPAGSKS